MARKVLLATGRAYKPAEPEAVTTYSRSLCERPRARGIWAWLAAIFAVVSITNGSNAGLIACAIVFVVSAWPWLKRLREMGETSA